MSGCPVNRTVHGNACDGPGDYYCDSDLWHSRCRRYFEQRAEVREALADLVHAEQIDPWIDGQFRGGPLKGHSPAELIAAGEGQRVLDFIEALKDGVFL